MVHNVTGRVESSRTVGPSQRASQASGTAPLIKLSAIAATAGVKSSAPRATFSIAAKAVPTNVTKRSANITCCLTNASTGSRWPRLPSSADDTDGDCACYNDKQKTSTLRCVWHYHVVATVPTCSLRQWSAERDTSLAHSSPTHMAVLMTI